MICARSSTMWEDLAPRCYILIRSSMLIAESSESRLTGTGSPEGEIGFGGLDVTEPEPLPRDYPLLSLVFTLGNVIMTMVDHPLHYFSRKWLPGEERYTSTVEKELFGSQTGHKYI